MHRMLALVSHAGIQRSAFKINCIGSFRSTKIFTSVIFKLNTLYALKAYCLMFNCHISAKIESD